MMLFWKYVKFYEVLLLTIVLALAHLLQITIILPLELMARSDNSSSIYSLVYIPHGVKALVVMFFGITGLVSVFISQVITSLFSDGYKDIAFVSGFIALLAFCMPWYLIGKIVKPTTFENDFVTNSSISAFWYFFTLGLGASLINGIGHHLLHNSLGKPDYLLMLKFSTGDMVGLLSFLFVVILSRKSFKKIVIT